jgi:SAM-dependent methyltransferase
VTAFPHVERLREAVRAGFPFRTDHVERAAAAFGESWMAELEDLLMRMFPEPAALERAAKGYCAFVLDGMLLMKRFEKEGAYVGKTYDEAAREVYHNAEYMSDLYLPGNLLSHYLWLHHYRQLVFFRNSLGFDLRASDDPRFYDVGIGTGFYSRVLLAAAPLARGIGFDVSEFSVAYARQQLERFGCADRYEFRLADVTRDEVEAPAPFLICVEVLEHLEDPPALLRVLRRMLAPGGKGLITAAITAPNADHIYLYRDAEEVHRQLRDAGFRLEQGFVAAAYRPRGSEPVPTVAAFVVT